MQYFTFIGMGDKTNGYKEVYYSFENNPEQAVLSRFVQDLIVEEYKDELDDIYIFVTEQSRKRYEEELVNKFKDNKISPYFIDIKWGITFEEFVSLLLNNMKDNEDVILDVTHSFRHIPMKLLFTLKYIELTKHVSIKHLYYGLLQPDDMGVVIDFVDDYKMQQISDLLGQFDRTLMINAQDVKSVISDKDDKMNRFLESLSTFNKMIEYCEFDHSLNEIRKITESCNGIIKDESKYSLIIPLVIKIKEKFDTYNKCTNDIDRKEELIRILIAHNRMQVAITFTDQFFREELIRNTLDPSNKKFSLQSYFSNHRISYNEDSFYNLSQYLRIDIYKISGGSANKRFPSLLNGKEEYISNVEKGLTEKYKKINKEFFSNIRNHMNHGTSIHVNIEPAILGMLDCIKRIGGRN